MKFLRSPHRWFICLQITAQFCCMMAFAQTPISPCSKILEAPTPEAIAYSNLIRQVMAISLQGQTPADIDGITVQMVSLAKKIFDQRGVRYIDSDPSILEITPDPKGATLNRVAAALKEKEGIVLLFAPDQLIRQPGTAAFVRQDMLVMAHSTVLINDFGQMTDAFTTLGSAFTLHEIRHAWFKRMAKMGKPSRFHGALRALPSKMITDAHTGYETYQNLEELSTYPLHLKIMGSGLRVMTDAAGREFMLGFMANASKIAQLGATQVLDYLSTLDPKKLSPIRASATDYLRGYYAGIPASLELYSVATDRATLTLLLPNQEPNLKQKFQARMDELTELSTRLKTKYGELDVVLAEIRTSGTPLSHSQDKKLTAILTSLRKMTSDLK